MSGPLKLPGAGDGPRQPHRPSSLQLPGSGWDAALAATKPNADASGPPVTAAAALGRASVPGTSAAGVSWDRAAVAAGVADSTVAGALDAAANRTATTTTPVTRLAIAPAVSFATHRLCARIAPPPQQTKPASVFKGFGQG